MQKAGLLQEEDARGDLAAVWVVLRSNGETTVFDNLISPKPKWKIGSQEVRSTPLTILTEIDPITRKVRHAFGLSSHYLHCADSRELKEWIDSFQEFVQNVKGDPPKLSATVSVVETDGLEGMVARLSDNGVSEDVFCAIKGSLLMIFASAVDLIPLSVINVKDAVITPESGDRPLIRIAGKQKVNGKEIEECENASIVLVLGSDSVRDAWLNSLTEAVSHGEGSVPRGAACLVNSDDEYSEVRFPGQTVEQGVFAPRRQGSSSFAVPRGHAKRPSGMSRVVRSNEMDVPVPKPLYPGLFVPPLYDGQLIVESTTAFNEYWATLHPTKLQLFASLFDASRPVYSFPLENCRFVANDRPCLHAFAMQLDYTPKKHTSDGKGKGKVVIDDEKDKETELSVEVPAAVDVQVRHYVFVFHASCESERDTWVKSIGIVLEAIQGGEEIEREAFAKGIEMTDRKLPIDAWNNCMKEGLCEVVGKSGGHVVEASRRWERWIVVHDGVLYSLRSPADVTYVGRLHLSGSKLEAKGAVLSVVRGGLNFSLVFQKGEAFREWHSALTRAIEKADQKVEQKMIDKEERRKQQLEIARIIAEERGDEEMLEEDALPRPEDSVGESGDELEVEPDFDAERKARGEEEAARKRREEQLRIDEELNKLAEEKERKEEAEALKREELKKKKDEEKMKEKEVKEASVKLESKKVEEIEEENEVARESAESETKKVLEKKKEDKKEESVKSEVKEEVVRKSESRRSHLRRDESKKAESRRSESRRGDSRSAVSRKEDGRRVEGKKVESSSRHRRHERPEEDKRRSKEHRDRKDHRVHRSSSRKSESSADADRRKGERKRKAGKSAPAKAAKEESSEEEESEEEENGKVKLPPAKAAKEESSEEEESEEEENGKVKLPPAKAAKEESSEEEESEEEEKGKSGSLKLDDDLAALMELSSKKKESSEEEESEEEEEEKGKSGSLKLDDDLAALMELSSKKKESSEEEESEEEESEDEEEKQKEKSAAEQLEDDLNALLELSGGKKDESSEDEIDVGDEIPVIVNMTRGR